MMSVTTEQSAALQAALSQVRASPKATWALVCGVIGMFVFAPLFSTVAITLGVVARNEIDRAPELEGRGKAVAGIVLGVIGLAFFAVWVTVQALS
jgi:hypothetical protein